MKKIGNFEGLVNLHRVTNVCIRSANAEKGKEMDINTNYSLNSGISMKGNLKTIAKALNRYDKRMLESQFDELVRVLPTKDGVINRNALDNADKEVFDKLKMQFEYYRKNVSMTFETIKKAYSGYLVNVKEEKLYNGTPATVARFINGSISSVKTSATNAKDAARLMGLDRYYLMGDTKTYYHEVLNDAGKVVERDCFIWDNKTKSMKLTAGIGRISDNQIGCSPIKDYKNSY